MTISEARASLSKNLSGDGFTERIAKPTEGEATKTSRIYFVKDLAEPPTEQTEAEKAAQRDREIIEEVLQEIMTNRGVSREEAEIILGRSADTKIDEKEQIKNRQRHQAMLSAIVRNDFSKLTDEQKAYWMNVY